MAEVITCCKCDSVNIVEVVEKPDYFAVIIEEGEVETAWIDSGEPTSVYMRCQNCLSRFDLEAEEYVALHPNCKREMEVTDD